MNINEHIQSLKAAIASAKEKQTVIATKSVDEHRSMSDVEVKEFDSLSTEVTSLEADLKRFETLEGSEASEAHAVEGKSGHTVKSVPLYREAKNTTKHAEGTQFARMARVLALSESKNIDATRLAENLYNDNDQVVNAVKAAVNPAVTSDNTYAGALVTDYEDITSDFISYLRPRTILGQFGQGGVAGLKRIPFNVSVRKQTQGGQAYWVGEAARKPTTSAGFDTQTHGRYKAATIAVLSEEVVQDSSPDSLNLMRDDLTNAMVALLDKQFIDSQLSGVGGVSPDPITKSANTEDAGNTDPLADLALLWQDALDNDFPTDGAVYIMRPALAYKASRLRDALDRRIFPDLTMRGGSIEGVPVIVSNYLPKTTHEATQYEQIVLVFAPEVYYSEGGIQIATSREASIVLTDEGSSSTAATSLWQNNLVGLRVEQFVNWSLRRSAAVQILDKVNW